MDSESGNRELRTRKPPCSGRERGRVKWFDAKKGIGFIQRVGAPDVFVHFTKIISVVRSFEAGELVEFTVKQGKRGPAAADVVRL